MNDKFIANEITKAQIIERILEELTKEIIEHEYRIYFCKCKMEELILELEEI